MDRNQKFAEIAKALDRGETPEPITVRQLLEWFDAQRRGTNRIEQIRRELLGFGLVTSPPFDSVWLDESISFVKASNADGPPPPGWARHLQHISEQLDRSEEPDPVTVRTLLGWFGVERRGAYVVQRIDDLLSEFNIKTEPDFKSVYIDAEVHFKREVELIEAPVTPKSEPLELGSAPPQLPSSKADSTAADVPAPQGAPAGEPVQAPRPAPVEETVPVTDLPDKDPSFTIGTLKASNLEAIKKKLVRIAPNATIEEAVTAMMTYSISHLPVMQNDRGSPKGIITWEAIGRYLAIKQGKSSDEVRHCMLPARDTGPDTYLFDVIDDIVERGHILIRSSDNRITGIVTPGDVSIKFRESAEPFLLLNEIENYVRSIVKRGKFTVKELEAACDSHDSRKIEGVHSLTLGELIRLLQKPENWERVKLAVDRKQVIDQLEDVRIIRNDVMHFRLDEVTGEKTDVLRRVTKFFQDLRSLKAI